MNQEYNKDITTQEEVPGEDTAAEDTTAVNPETEEAEAGFSETAEDAAEEIPEAEKEKKGFFGKKKDKKDPRDIQIEELNDRLKRQMAEFDNFRKRTDKEKSSMYELGSKDMIERILPVVDNFERGLASVSEEAKESPYAQGMEMIYKQLMKALEDVGVRPIEALGQQFDPNLHNAVMHIEDETLGENVIAQELQKGYMYRDTVIRYSMVQVAN